jgi:hypothetical protein
MSDYPKIMCRASGEEITVFGRVEQGEREADGWKAMDGSIVSGVDTIDPPEDAAFVAPTDSDERDEPTFGPADDQTHAKRSRKKK